MPITRVHLTAGDKVGWAIDEDLRLVRDSLAGVCEVTSLAKAEVVHSGWWVNLLPYSPADFRGKHVVCTAENAPFYYITEPEFLKVREMVTQWIVRSREGAAQFAALGIESRYAPYTFDPAVFHPLPLDHPEVQKLVRRWSIPTEKYLVANFHRDTEGADLRSPKIQKGPDAFLEIVTLLRDRGADFHVLLAGPRRFYLRRELAARRIPFTFVGEDTGANDDLTANTLHRSVLNLLYSIADAQVVSSRWEGGPQSVLEAAATCCKIISTRVGLAPDVLEPGCLFDTVFEAADLLERDIATGVLDASVEPQFQRVSIAHTEPALREHLREIYRSLEPLPASGSGSGRSIRRVADRLLGRFKAKPAVRSIALVHEPKKETSNAFDDFLRRLADELRERGCGLADAADGTDCDAVLLGRVTPGNPHLEKLSPSALPPVIGFLDDESAANSAASIHRQHCACVLLSSIEALTHLQTRGEISNRTLVIPPVATATRATATAEPVLLRSDDPWAGGRIQQALASGAPILYPHGSHYEYAVWFGGLALRDAESPSEKLATFSAHHDIFARLAAPVSIASVADRLLRLISTTRELLTDESDD